MADDPVISEYGHELDDLVAFYPPNDHLEPHKLKVLLALLYAGRLLTTLKLYPSEEDAVRLAENGSAEIHNLICDSAERALDAGKDIPIGIQKYLIRVAKAGRRHGQSGPRNLSRDQLIAFVVDEISRQGFYPTRNEATTDESACSIVAMALKCIGTPISERGVAKIVERRKPLEPTHERTNEFVLEFVDMMRTAAEGNDPDWVWSTEEGSHVSISESATLTMWLQRKSALICTGIVYLS